MYVTGYMMVEKEINERLEAIGLPRLYFEDWTTHETGNIPDFEVNSFPMFRDHSPLQFILDNVLSPSVQKFLSDKVDHGDVVLV